MVAASRLLPSRRPLPFPSRCLANRRRAPASDGNGKRARFRLRPSHPGGRRAERRRGFHDSDVLADPPMGEGAGGPRERRGPGAEGRGGGAEPSAGGARSPERWHRPPPQPPAGVPGQVRRGLRSAREGAAAAGGPGPRKGGRGPLGRCPGPRCLSGRPKGRLRGPRARPGAGGEPVGEGKPRLGLHGDSAGGDPCGGRPVVARRGTNPSPRPPFPAAAPSPVRQQGASSWASQRSAVSPLAGFVGPGGGERPP